MFQPQQPITFDHAKSALEEGLRAIASGQTSIDLARVASIDSSAVAVLLVWQRAAKARASDLQITNAPASLSALATLYGVAELLQIHVRTPERADLPHH